MILLKNISFSYPKSSINVLENLNVTFEKGIANILIGLNGAGKTTMFDILIGETKPLKGEIINFPILSEVLYHVQGAYISYLVTGKDYIKLVFTISGKKFIKEIDVLIEDMGLVNTREKDLLKGLWNKRIGQMSVGERRWLYITTLCQIKKKVYIFDEPTAGVDPSSRIIIYKRLEELVENNEATLIVSTHHLHELKNMRCKIILLHKGKLLFEGSYSQFIGQHNTINPDEAFDKFITSSYDGIVAANAK
ncbi:ATP-binding cassette domain-containing protein [Paenibacillus sp. FSL H7-0350]|uniref:ATP-binding cassette domain-containing protein n=1 Tax=Paenibacillus sp. FSL H7-0350 TaxID=2975345 RepID=UPI00315963E8